MTKLDRLARSLPDARAIADELTTRQISLSLGGSVYDPTDAVGRLLFNVLAMVAWAGPQGQTTAGTASPDRHPAPPRVDAFQVEATRHTCPTQGIQRGRL
jgi:hypothetical protein